MSATTDAVLAWLLRGGVWWALLAAGLFLWFRVRPPKTATVRHAALAAAILAGTLVEALPRWGAGVVASSEAIQAIEESTEPPIHRSDEIRNAPLFQPTKVASQTGTNRNAAVSTSREPPPTEIASLPPVETLKRDWPAIVRLVFGAFWLAGALLMGLRLARAALVAARWRGEAQPLPPTERAAFDAARRELRIRRQVDARLYSGLTTPLVLCGIRPLVLVPGDWMDWDESSRKAAWRHELAHVQRWDDWWRVLSELLRVVWWFHPGVRWLLARREFEAELLSDEAAVTSGCPPQEFAQILIDACRRPTTAWPAPAGSLLTPRTMKARIARLIDATSAAALCRPAPRALPYVAAAGVVVLASAGSMRWVAAAHPAEPASLPRPEEVSTVQTTDRTKVVVRLIDAEAGAPVVRAACEWGLANPDKPGEFMWGFRGSAVGRDGSLEMTFDLERGRLIRFQVLAAGYDRAEVVEEIPRPTPASLERVVRLKRGRMVTGTLRDHEGKPVVDGRVFFVPAGRAWQSLRIVEGVADSPSVAETRTNADGSFRLSAGQDGTLAASTDAVDLWAFPLPPTGERADLVLPKPAHLTIDLAYWYLDAPRKDGPKISSESDDPNQCWVLVNRLGTRDPLVDAIDYHRVMCLFAGSSEAKVAKGVSVGAVQKEARSEAVPGDGRNRRTATTIRVALPPGRYSLQRLRAGAGAYAPIDRTVVDLKAGGETALAWARSEGASVRGRVRLPERAAFVRTPGEAPRKLDWSVPTTAFVVLRSADGVVRDAARIEPDGGFFVATHLEPGAYKAEALVILPRSNKLPRSLVEPPPDLGGSQDFIVAVPPKNATGAAPVAVEVTMRPRGERIVSADVAQTPATLLGTVELPTGLLFRRQAKNVAVVGPNPRPIGFKGLSIDPDDGRVVEELGWKHVQHIDVFVKANDGRDFKAYTKAKGGGDFAFDQPLPPGGYQVDAAAILELDDDAKVLLDEPRPDLNAATVLIRVNPGDRSPIRVALTLHTAPFARRLRHEDPAKRSPELRGTITHNGNPVRDARIVLYGGFATRWKIAENATDDAGKYRVENVASSVVRSGDVANHYVGVQIEHPRLVPADGKSWRDITIPTKPGVVETLNLSLAEAGFIEGRLLAADGSPRLKAPLRMYVPVKPGQRRGPSLFHAYATTDERGAFRSPPLFPGRYFAEENARDYPLLGEVVVEAGKTSSLPAK